MNILKLALIVVAIPFLAASCNVRSVSSEYWQVYTNDEYGFSIKYPPEWKIEKVQKYEADGRFIPVEVFWDTGTSMDVSLNKNSATFSDTPNDNGVFGGKTFDVLEVDFTNVKTYTTAALDGRAMTLFAQAPGGFSGVQVGQLEAMLETLQITK